MADEPDSLVFVMLRRLDSKMDEMSLDVRDMKQRLTTLEIALANQVATEASHYANIAVRIDPLEDRMMRIENRLDLFEPA